MTTNAEATRAAIARSNARLTDSHVFLGKCGCGQVVTVEWTWDTAGANSYQTLCPKDHRRVVVAKVDARKGKRACADYCWEGTGRKCTCQCEGRNHGGAYRVR